MTRVLPQPAKAPCPTCPYRKDVPSGIWDPSEYAKLHVYDGDTGEQFMKGGVGLFMCHQQNGCLCSGWVGCHDPLKLAALRLNVVHPSTYDYKSPVPLFSSGAEAAEHGLRNIDAPEAEASLAIVKILDQREKRKEGKIRKKILKPKSE